MDGSDLLLAWSAGGFALGFALAWLWRGGRERASGKRGEDLLTAFAPREELATARAALAEQQRRGENLRSELTAACTQADHLADELARTQGALEVAHAQERRQQDLRHQAEREATELRGELRRLGERLTERQAEFDRLRAQSRDEFASVSADLLRVSGETLRAEHERALRQLLDPVRAKLRDFEEQVDRKFSDEARDKATLRAQIEQLTSLNRDLSREAQQLTLALKGDSKAQGDWGELCLEGLLEAAGLVAGTHFDTQVTIRADSGRQQRPDCIVRLPQERCLVVDAKVSLTAYERFCASATDEEGAEHLRAHVLSLRTHIRQLAGKRYQDLYQVRCPDYVLLFVPVEPAFIAAVRERPALFTEALEQGVVLVSPSTLLATMRTVAYIWQQDDQAANAQAIAEVGRKLYDKLCGFVDDMEAVGLQLDRARGSYDAAMDKLCRSPKRGTTLVARANELKSLGVASKRVLDQA